MDTVKAPQLRPLFCRHIQVHYRPLWCRQVPEQTRFNTGPFSVDTSRSSKGSCCADMFRWSSSPYSVDMSRVIAGFFCLGLIQKVLCTPFQAFQNGFPPICIIPVIQCEVNSLSPPYQKTNSCKGALQNQKIRRPDIFLISRRRCKYGTATKRSITQRLRHKT